jgi:hypothetical protein
MRGIQVSSPAYIRDNKITPLSVACGNVAVCQMLVISRKKGSALVLVHTYLEEGSNTIKLDSD